jgi:glycosyltransferase involved in cell wall biosynthesis
MQSIPRFVRMLAEGMSERGHRVEVWTPKAFFFKLPFFTRLGRRWLGYIDQYFLFPLHVKSRLKGCPADTLFVFTDHALGPWVPLVSHRPHVIHCHDFLAQISALGEFQENKTSWTGQHYQAYIRDGYSQGKNFVSVSEKTRKDLFRFLKGRRPFISEVVYNGMNQTFTSIEIPQARSLFGTAIGLNLTSGYILHVGGNQWYKNRLGVLEIYNAWRKQTNLNLPLVLIGEMPNENLLTARRSSKYKSDIFFISNVEDELVRMAYTGASVFVFPSIAEGFGWPIAEAMASGCPVITTNEAPMTEVAGKAAFLIPRRPTLEVEVREWAANASKKIEQILGFSKETRKVVIEAGITNAKRFDTITALDKIEKIYRKVVFRQTSPSTIGVKDNLLQ